MQVRIRTHIAKGEIRKAQYLSEKLLRRSKPFHMYIANRAIKGWYWRMTEKKWLDEFNKYRSAVSNLKSKLDVTRFYIPKADGKRMRPIGSPAHWSKMYYLSLEVILREFLEPQIGEYQHGFMRGRGTQTASLDLINRIKGKKEVYQFDLDGCFNRINYRLICGRINSMWKGMGNLLLNITLRTFPHMKEYHEEKEIFKQDNKWVRRGFTQGSPLSPLLSIWAMEFAGMGNIDNLVMYADDGIIVRNDVETIESELTNSSKKVGGILLAEDKGNGIVSKFKFLGLNYDLEQQTVNYNNMTVSLNDAKGIKKIVKYSKYTKATINKWEVMEESRLWNHYTIKQIICDNWHKEGWGVLFNIPRILKNVIWNRNIEEYIDVQSESTKCCLWTLKNSPSLSNYRNRRKLLKNYKGWDIVKKWNAGIEEPRRKWYWTNENWASLNEVSIDNWLVHKAKKS